MTPKEKREKCKKENPLPPPTDHNGVTIREGSVLRNIKDSTIGVVVKVLREGDMGTAFDYVGDLHIYTGTGSRRCTNKHKDWIHVPRKYQTYRQRLLAWKMVPYENFLFNESISEDEDAAIKGIMAMLPEDPVNWEDGPWPDSIENALGFLVDHMEELVTKEAKRRENRMAVKLTPPDYNQCQAEIHNGYNAFTLGGVPAYERCTNEAEWLAVEKKTDEDGVTGSMSLCSSCKEGMIKQCGEDFASFTPLEREVAT